MCKWIRLAVLLCCGFICFSANSADSSPNQIKTERRIYYLEKSNNNEMAFCELDEKDNTEISCDNTNMTYDNHNIEWQGDLNGDGKIDYILRLPFGRWRDEVSPFIVLIAKDSDSFYESGGFFATDFSITDKKENGFHVLLKHSICCLLNDYLYQFERWAYVKYNQKTLEYETELEQPHENGVTTICRVDSWPEYMKTRVPPGFENIINSPEPSFDCKKANNQVEKMICANGYITKLDIYLADNFLRIKMAITSPEQEKLVADQRKWLKQRNSCKTEECLINAYRTRLKELCTNSPVNPCYSDS